MRLGLTVIALALNSVLSAKAQQGGHAEAVGTVTGHVFCADTQRPARLAQVKLVRLPSVADLKLAGKSVPLTNGSLSGNPVETSLDGSYSIRNVKPGEYYVVADMQGYLLPLGEFTEKELAATDTPSRTRIAKSVHTVTVEAQQVTREEIVLQRGATVSGTITYDDGTPAFGLGIKLLVKSQEGKWAPLEHGRYRSHSELNSTDDQGNYRITGLPPGVYATEADLILADYEISSGPMPGNPTETMEMEVMKIRFSLPLYSGDVMHLPDTIGYSLGSGEARAGSDLVFPLTKLHKIGGQVLAKDGHAVNTGEVKLVYADDKSETAAASILYEDQAFHLDYVPEGQFVLKVTDAKDVTRQQVENAPGYTPRFHEETKTLKTYGETERPLLVKGDQADVIATVPDDVKTKAGSATD